MSDLPAQLPSSIEPQSINLTDCIPGSAAADRLSRDRDGFTRTCRMELAPLGLAFMAASPAAGQMQWYVKRSYDPRLADDGAGKMSIGSLEQCTGKQREFALQRWACVQAFRKVINSPGPIEPRKAPLIERLRERFPDLGISRNSLHGWHNKAYRGIAALIDRRGGHQAAEAAAEAWKAFEDLYLHQNQPTVRHCWRIVKNLAAENGWRWISYSQCRRQLDGKIPPEKQAFHRTPKLYRTQFAPYIQQNEESWRAGQRWVSDHKQMDLWACWLGQIIRPWLTIWIDWRTRRIVGWALSDSPTSSTILGSLRMGLKDPFNCGGPAEIVCDNGRDYGAAMFHGSTKKERRSTVSPRVDEDVAHGIFAHLGIAAHFAIPFNPNGKSRCERFFGNLASFARTFETFCGISSETKPERLKKILADPAKIPTFAEVETRLAAFIDEHNNNADHAIDDLSENGVKLSPNEAFAKWCDTRRVMADPAALDLLLAHWHKPVTVGRNGFTLTIRGQRLHYGQTTDALRSFKAPGRKVKPVVNVSIDESAMGSVRVYDSQFRFITVAPLNCGGGSAGGVTLADCGANQRKMAAYRKSLRHDPELAIANLSRPEEQVISTSMKRREAEQRAALAAAQPSSIIGIQTPLDGQAKHLKKHELKIAVGAESLSENERPRVDIFERLISQHRATAPQIHQPRPDLLEHWRKS